MGAVNDRGLRKRLFVRWKKWGEYAAQSNCTRYSVSRSLVSNQWVFEAWHDPLKKQIHLGHFKTSKEAYAACVQHEGENNAAHRI
jgi:hypothetical protein